MSENIKDPIDYSSQMSEAARARTVQEVRLKCIPKQEKVQVIDEKTKELIWVWPEPDCVECGEPIGEERLEATGTDTCIECATLKEKKEKQHGRH